MGFALGVIGTITVSTDVVTSSSLLQSMPALPGQMTCGMTTERVTWGVSGLTYGMLGCGEGAEGSETLVPIVTSVVTWPTGQYVMNGAQEVLL